MPHKILIIDDDRINTALVKFMLAERCYEVICAEDGEKGLEKVKTEKPDLIILDIKMPRMNGYEFMTELKSMQGFLITPVIMLTAHENLEDIFMMEGVSGYFVKPVDLNALLKKIEKCLGPNPV
jgi:CheY-like chemotaxis protein